MAKLPLLRASEQRAYLFIAETVVCYKEKWTIKYLQGLERNFDLLNMQDSLQALQSGGRRARPSGEGSPGVRPVLGSFEIQTPGAKLSRGGEQVRQSWWSGTHQPHQALHAVCRMGTAGVVISIRAGDSLCCQKSQNRRTDSPPKQVTGQVMEMEKALVCNSIKTCDQDRPCQPWHMHGYRMEKNISQLLQEQRAL